MLEREILILSDRNIRINSSLKTFSTGSNTEALWKKKKANVKNHSVAAYNKMCQAMMESSVCAGDMSGFCQLFQRGVSSISILYLCQHSGRDTASRVNDKQRDRWFLLSSGVMAPSLVSVIEPRLTDRQIHSCRLMMTFVKWHILFCTYQFVFPALFGEVAPPVLFPSLIAIITTDITSTYFCLK